MEVTNMNAEFKAKLDERLAFIAIKDFEPDKEEFSAYEDLYHYVEHYIYEKQLFNAAVALHLSLYLYKGLYRTHNIEADEKPQLLNAHCLSVCKMLVDLNAPLSAYDEDIAIAASLCHEAIAYIHFPKRGRELCEEYLLDPRVFEIVSFLSKGRNLSKREKIEFFDHVKKDPIMLLVRLADRGNIVEQLYNMSVWTAHEYIYDTRTYYFPMCIYAKEAYPQLVSVISLVMEKMRCLIEATEILVSRYEKREMELTNEILTLQEENARIRNIIREQNI